MPSAPARRSPPSTSRANFERDMLARKRPQVVIFYNKQYFTPGNIASGALAARGLGRDRRPCRASAGGPAGFTPGPLVVEQYVLTNPGAELRPVPAAGDPADRAARRDRDRRRLRRRLGVRRAQTCATGCAAAGGSPLTALVGKLAPYFGIFLLMMVVEARHHPWPLRGALPGRSAADRGVAACLLIVGLSVARRAASSCSSATSPSASA